MIVALLIGAETEGANTEEGPVLRLAELRALASAHGRALETFRAEGTVRAIDREHHLVAMEDGSDGLVVEVPELPAELAAGDRVQLVGDHCALTRTRFGLALGTAPVVNVDGHHPTVTKSGKVYLEAGLQPIRASWFNGVNDSAFKIEYEGPGVPHQAIPENVLWRAAGTNDFVPGLDFAAYTGNWTYTTPDFASVTPVARGVATNFDLRYSVQPNDTGLVFSGFIKIAEEGMYTFTVSADDGGVLYVGKQERAGRMVVLEHQEQSEARTFEPAVAGWRDGFWTEVEGEVTYMGKSDQDVELDLVTREGDKVEVTVVEGASLAMGNWLHQRCRVAGMLEGAADNGSARRGRLITIPAAGKIGVASLNEQGDGSVETDRKGLTAIWQIRNLTRAEATRRLRVTIRGVVIWTSHEAFVLEDGTGGVYVQYTPSNWAEEPAVGEAWEIRGITDPGFFSPVIEAQKAVFLGRAAMPEPIRPTGDQLLNGSLDAEYVELRGALIGITPQDWTLLTAEGTIKIYYKDDWPLPRVPQPLASDRTLVDSIVRIRGCVSARVFLSPSDADGKLHLGAATVEVEDPAPREFFALPNRRVADLLRFDPRAGVLQRTKIEGQIVFGRGGEYFLQDGEAGLRILTKGAETLRPGDMVEAVGFPQLGGASPLLREARVKILEERPLPPARVLAEDALVDRAHDATRVRVTATLLQDRMERNDRLLHLRAGHNYFTAQMSSGKEGSRVLKPGSKVQLTGVYVSVAGDQPGGSMDAFRLWLNSPADIQVLQEPPWWTMERAITAMGVLGAVLCLAVVWIMALRRKVEERTVQLKRQIEGRQLVEQQRAMEHERTRVAQDLHDELGVGLTEVGLLGDLVKNPAVPVGEKQQYLKQLTDTARSLVSSLDEIVWAINPHYDSVGSLASYYTQFAQRFLNLAGVTCRLRIPVDFPHYALDSKTRHAVFLAFREALNNVVQHAGATEVCLEIRVADERLEISVADNGRGFDVASEAPGADGLRGMRQRLEQLGGGCEVRSNRQSGTEVRLTLPIKKRI